MKIIISVKCNIFSNELAHNTIALIYAKRIASLQYDIHSGANYRAYQHIF